MRVWMETFSGLKFDMENPTEDMVNIMDIAHALSNICRYTGQCRKYYSVAEHCVLGAKLFESNTAKKICLLHDAHEAYYSDLSRPLKLLLPEYEKYASRCQEVIWQKFFGRQITKEEYAPIKVVDDRMLLDEAKVMMVSKGEGWSTKWTDHNKAAPVAIRFWTPEQAEEEFLKKWNKANAEFSALQQKG